MVCEGRHTPGRETDEDRKFEGEVIVIVDSRSASASEVFARVMQIEKRGKIVGDVTAGAVMTSYQLSMANRRGPDGFQTISLYGMNVTIADVIMSDGNRLEKIGVIPDHPVGPTATALANRSDPVLAFASGLMGARISPDAPAISNSFLRRQKKDGRPRRGQGQ